MKEPSFLVYPKLCVTKTQLYFKAKRPFQIWLNLLDFVWQRFFKSEVRIDFNNQPTEKKISVSDGVSCQYLAESLPYI